MRTREKELPRQLLEQYHRNLGDEWDYKDVIRYTKHLMKPKTTGGLGYAQLLIAFDESASMRGPFWYNTSLLDMVQHVVRLGKLTECLPRRIYTEVKCYAFSTGIRLLHADTNIMMDTRVHDKGLEFAEGMDMVQNALNASIDLLLLGGCTNLHWVLDEAIKMADKNRNQLVLVVFTDGRATEPDLVRLRAKELKDRDIFVVQLAIFPEPLRATGDEDGTLVIPEAAALNNMMKIEQLVSFSGNQCGGRMGVEECGMTVLWKEAHDDPVLSIGGEELPMVASFLSNVFEILLYGMKNNILDIKNRSWREAIRFFQFMAEIHYSVARYTSNAFTCTRRMKGALLSGGLFTSLMKDVDRRMHEIILQRMTDAIYAAWAPDRLGRRYEFVEAGTISRARAIEAAVEGLKVTHPFVDNGRLMIPSWILIQNILVPLPEGMPMHSSIEGLTPEGPDKIPKSAIAPDMPAILFPEQQIIEQHPVVLRVAARHVHELKAYCAGKDAGWLTSERRGIGVLAEMFVDLIRVMIHDHRIGQEVFFQYLLKMLELPIPQTDITWLAAITEDENRYMCQRIEPDLFKIGEHPIFRNALPDVSPDECLDMFKICVRAGPEILIARFSDRLNPDVRIRRTIAIRDVGDVPGELPDGAVCAVCMEVYDTPMSTPGGQTFCERCCDEICRVNGGNKFICPLTRAEYLRTDLARNRSLESVIEHYKETYLAHEKRNTIAYELLVREIRSSCHTSQPIDIETKKRNKSEIGLRQEEQRRIAAYTSLQKLRGRDAAPAAAPAAAPVFDRSSRLPQPGESLTRWKTRTGIDNTRASITKRAYKMGLIAQNVPVF